MVDSNDKRYRNPRQGNNRTGRVHGTTTSSSNASTTRPQYYPLIVVQGTAHYVVCGGSCLYCDNDTTSSSSISGNTILDILDEVLEIIDHEDLVVHKKG